MTDIQKLLNTLMRSIDKGTSLTVEPSQDPNRAGVTVHLARDRKTGALEVAETDLVAAQSDLIRRNQLRTALKRSRDRMFEERGYLFDTKMPTHRQDGGQWFRPAQGGGRGRR